MAINRSAKRGVQESLQSVATTGNGIALALPPSFRDHRVNIQGNGAVGAGAIQIETASVADYAGTWSPLGSPITVPADSQVDVNFSGVFGAVRARISTTVTVGTVTVTYQGN